MTPQDYEVAIRTLTQAEGGGFGATVPELPGCRADSAGSAGEVYDAIACWVEAAQDMGRPVPLCPDCASRHAMQDANRP